MKENTTYNQIRVMFSVPPQYMNMIRDRGTGKFRGYCFVTFASAEEAMTALREVHRRVINDRQVNAAYAHEK